jgi:hypothetical protein
MFLVRKESISGRSSETLWELRSLPSSRSAWFLGKAEPKDPGFSLEQNSRHLFGLSKVFKNRIVNRDLGGGLLVGGAGTPPFWRTRNEFCTVWNSVR